MRVCLRKRAFLPKQLIAKVKNWRNLRRVAAAAHVKHQNFSGYHVSSKTRTEVNSSFARRGQKPGDEEVDEGAVCSFFVIKYEMCQLISWPLPNLYVRPPGRSQTFSFGGATGGVRFATRGAANGLCRTFQKET